MVSSKLKFTLLEEDRLERTGVLRGRHPFVHHESRTRSKTKRNKRPLAHHMSSRPAKGRTTTHKGLTISTCKQLRQITPTTLVHQLTQQPHVNQLMDTNIKKMDDI
jgi:hypothetical protein